MSGTALEAPSAPGDAVDPSERVGASLSSHPRGLLVIALASMWERFSYFGMSALLMLYMVDHLLKQQQVIWGMASFRGMVEWLRGPMSDVALAAQIGGLYSAFIYFTPALGGWIGDRWLGQRRTVILGAMLMTAGHLMLAWEPGFLLALLMLVIGNGAVVGNGSAQVGHLYPDGDHRRDAGFMLFNMTINIGGMLAPLICGTLGEKYGYDYGFFAAAAGMAIGLFTYWGWQRYLPADRISSASGEQGRLTREEWRRLGGIAAVLLIGAPYGAAFYEVFGVFVLWVRDHVDRNLFGFQVPATWLLSLPGFGVVAMSPLLLRFWRWQASRGREPGDLAKIGWAYVIGVVAYGFLSLVTALNGHPSVGWVALFTLLVTLGFLWYWPLTLAIVSKTAPPRVNSTMMGTTYMALFVANNVVGFLGRYYETVSAAHFWLIQAGLCLAGLVVLLAVQRPLSRLLGLRVGG